MPLLEIRNLVVRYGEIEALRGVTFSVEEGQVVTPVVVAAPTTATTVQKVYFTRLIVMPNQSTLVYVALNEADGRGFVALGSWCSSGNDTVHTWSLNSKAFNYH